LPTRTERSANRWLPQIVFLLWVLVLALLLGFCYFASSLFITVLLSAFLAILVDPFIMFLERFRISRVISAAVVMAVGMLLIAALSYVSYRQISSVADDLPIYTQRIGQAIAPLVRRAQKLEDDAGRIATSVPKRKVPEVKLHSNYPDWTSYVVRGVGPISGAIIIIGVVPFLMFFLLVQKKRLKQKLAIVWGDQIDVANFASSITQMVRGFVLSNLVIGVLMALTTTLVLFLLKVDSAMVLGIASGLLNLIPFLGAILGALIPIAAAFVQNQPLGNLLIILVTVVGLHTVSINLLIPKILGQRVSISPVAATVGILFWGWLWGALGVLLAVPLTALVKIIADSHPSLDKLGNLLAERPVRIPPWSRITGAPVKGQADSPRTDAQTSDASDLRDFKDASHKTPT
jgi:predicted PurR-regulated permease PerM